jgi:hypothetical protein
MEENHEKIRAFGIRAENVSRYLPNTKNPVRQWNPVLTTLLKISNIIQVQQKDKEPIKNRQTDRQTDIQSILAHKVLSFPFPVKNAYSVFI